MNRKITALISIALITIFSLVSVPKAAAATATPVTITFPAQQLTHTPPGGNVRHLGMQTLPNGEYRVSIEVTNTTLYSGNSLMIISGPQEKTPSRTTHMAMFRNVGLEKSYTSTYPKNMIVDQGGVTIALALGVTLGSDKAFDGSVKVIMTPVAVAQPQAQAVATKPAPKAEPKPQVAAATTTETTAPATLPATGAENIVLAFTGMSAAGYAAHQLVSKKRR